MSRSNQVWGHDVTDVQTDTVWAERLGERRLQLNSEARDGTMPSPAAAGEREWIFVSHTAAEAVAWAQGNSIQRATAAVNEFQGLLVASAAPVRGNVLGLAQNAWAASTLQYGWIGRNGAFEALQDGTLDDAESAVATNNSGDGHVAGVAITASTGAHIGFPLEDSTPADEALGTIMLELM